MANLTAAIRIGAALQPNALATFRKAEGAATRLGTSLKRVGLPAGAAGDLKRYRTALGSLDETQTRARRSSLRLREAIGGIGRQLSKVGGIARRAGGAVGGALRSAHGLALGPVGTAVGIGGALAAARQVQRAFTLEEARIRLRDVVVTESGTDASKDAAVRAIVAETSGTARGSLATERELLAGAYEASSAGVRADVAAAVAEVGHRVGTVTSGDTGEVVKILSRSLNLFGDRIRGDTDRDKVARIGDLLTVLQQSEQLSSFGALGESVRRGSSGLLRSKADPTEGFAALAVLNSLGREGSSAGTGLEAFLRELPKAAKKLDFAVARGADGTLELTENVRRIRASLAGLDSDAASLRLGKAMSEEAASIAVLLADATDRVDRLTKAADEDGVVIEGYGRRLESAGGKAKIAGQNAQSAGDAITTSLLPAIGKSLEPLGGYGQRLAELIERSPAAEQAVRSLAGGFVALGLAFAGIKIGGALLTLLATPAGAVLLPAIVAGVAANYAANVAATKLEPRSLALEREFEDRVTGRSHRGFLPHLPRQPARNSSLLQDESPRTAEQEHRNELRREESRERRERRHGESPPAADLGRTGAPLRHLTFEAGAIIVNGAGLPEETAFALLRRIDEEDRARAGGRAQYDDEP